MVMQKRWQLRFENFLKALQTLDEAMELVRQRELSNLEQQGLVQGFEFTHELAWNVLKDYLEHQGIVGLIGSRDATRSAFKNGLIQQGEVWMQMIADRNLTSQAYEKVNVQAMVLTIIQGYHPAFKNMADRFSQLYSQSEDEKYLTG
ncbi:MAG: nucleotidyltransferase [Magnetococcales bacterium]|nr:nucleotidyltransferase [Magnetococcales bacterium]